MNIDDKIKQELSDEAKQLDDILAHEPGIFDMLLNAFKGSLGIWMIIAGVFSLILAILMFWCGYHFFFVKGDEMFKLHWGIGLLLATMMQIALKMWSFMEMNRQSMIRELKRVELAVERLENKLSDS